MRHHEEVPTSQHYSLINNMGYDFCMYSSHEKVIEDNKGQYYVALRQAQSTLKSRPDINPWFLYFLKVLDQQRAASSSWKGRKREAGTD